MFEILIADPAAIAVLGTVGGGIGLRCIEKSLSKKKKARPPAVMSFKESTAYTGGRLPPPPREKTVFDCAVYDQRLFEKELVEAKVIPNIESRCEDKECPECYPNRPGNSRKEAPAIGTTNNTKKWREPKVYDAARVEKAKAEKKRAAEAFAKSRAGRQRVAEVSGRIVPIPNNVPRFATGQLVYDSAMLGSFIGWRWHDEDDARKPIRSYRQNISDEVFDSFPLASSIRPPVGVVGDNGFPRPPKGKGAGSPKPTSMEEIRKVLKNQQEQVKREREFLMEEKNKLMELNKRISELHNSFDRIGSQQVKK